MEIKDKCKELIARNEIENAISHLEENRYSFSNPEIRNEIVIFRMRYNRIIQKEMKNLLTSNDFDVMLTKLVRDILNFIDNTLE